MGIGTPRRGFNVLVYNQQKRDRERKYSPLPTMKPCPICGGRADINVVAPWPKDAGPAPYYANCYRMTPIEHCVGVNGDTQRETMELWNAEVDKISALSTEQWRRT